MHKRMLKGDCCACIQASGGLGIFDMKSIYNAFLKTKLVQEYLAVPYLL